MPLIRDDSQESISKNIETLKKEGKRQEQAIAIALEIAREVKKRQNNDKAATKANRQT